MFKTAASRLPAVAGIVVLSAGSGFAAGALAAHRADNEASTVSASSTTAVSIVRTDLSTSTSASGALGHARAPWKLIGGLGGTVTSEAAIDTTVSSGGFLYAVDDRPVRLLVGTVPFWRPISVGTTGADVKEFKAAMVALLPGRGLSVDSTYTARDAAVVSAWQRTNGYPDGDGSVPLGEFIVEPTDVRIDAADAGLGDVVAPGAEALAVTSTQRVVNVTLPADLAGVLQQHTTVMVQIDATAVSGEVAAVGQAPSSQSQAPPGGQPGISVTVNLPESTKVTAPDGGRVQVVVTTGRAKQVLAVPVSALLALAEGGYGVEVMQPSGASRLVGVKVGLVDDSRGLVEVSGPGVVAGGRVLVPVT